MRLLTIKSLVWACHLLDSLELLSPLKMGEKKYLNEDEYIFSFFLIRFRIANIYTLVYLGQGEEREQKSLNQGIGIEQNRML